MGYQWSLSEKILEKSIYLFFICGIIYLLVSWLQPKLFNVYVFKYVIDKNYLSIRDFSDPLPPENNLYNDADEKYAEKRMNMINQRVIKTKYQDFVELTSLNINRITNVEYCYDADSNDIQRMPADIDTIYYPIFTVHPFGKEANFYIDLVKFKLSRKAAFTATGVKYLAISDKKN